MVSDLVKWFLLQLKKRLVRLKSSEQWKLIYFDLQTIISALSISKSRSKELSKGLLDTNSKSHVIWPLLAYRKMISRQLFVKLQDAMNVYIYIPISVLMIPILFLILLGFWLVSVVAVISFWTISLWWSLDSKTKTNVKP